MTDWGALLDDFEANVAATEAALDADGWSADPTAPFTPPVTLPEIGPTSSELERWDELQRRAEDCRSRLQLRLRASLDDLSGLGRTRTAAAAYLRGSSPER